MIDKIRMVRSMNVEVIWQNMLKLLSKNKFTTEIYFDSYGNTTTTTNAAYEYNSNGYPVNMLLTGEDSGGNYPATYQCI